MNRRTLLKSALAAALACVVPWRVRREKPLAERTLPAQGLQVSRWCWTGWAESLNHGVVVSGYSDENGLRFITTVSHDGVVVSQPDGGIVLRPQDRMAALRVGHSCRLMVNDLTLLSWMPLNWVEKLLS